MAQTSSNTSSVDHPIGLRGLLAAGAVISAWGLSLTFLLLLEAATWHPAFWVIFVGVQTFLHTGLFITAHDAMHGTVYPRNPRLNDSVGTLATTLYALFSYRKLQDKHWEHHEHPGTDEDPDFHDQPSFWSWYANFVTEYVGIWQIVGMALVYNIAHHGFGVPTFNLNLFWVLPSLLSTLQLFYFGTYLPHRPPDGGFDDQHRSTTNEFHPVVSFLTCYHFGYHWEHHEHPGCPWWRLHRLRRRLDSRPMTEDNRK